MAHRVGTALMAYLALRAIRVRSVLPAPLGLTAQLASKGRRATTVLSGLLDPRVTPAIPHRLLAFSH
jgi:hypothetical protein